MSWSWSWSRRSHERSGRWRDRPTGSGWGLRLFLALLALYGAGGLLVGYRGFMTIRPLLEPTALFASAATFGPLPVSPEGEPPSAFPGEATVELSPTQ